MATTNSPPLSFLPTPAVIGPENVDPGRVPSEQRSTTVIPGPGQQSFEKPFHSRSTTSSSIIHNNGTNSPIVSSPSRHKSMDPATSHKLLSHAGSSPILYPASFIDQSRALLDQQRRHFDQERAMWDMERKALYGRIEELERVVATAATAAVEESPSRQRIPLSSGKEGLMTTRKPLSFNHPHHPPKSGSEKKEQGLVRHSSMPESGGGGDKFWEGGSSQQGLIPSRVFNAPTTTFMPTNGTTLPTISEKQNNGNDEKGKDGVPMLNQGIDISLIQHDLDGITLKTSAVPASIISKITSPTSPSRKGHVQGGQHHLSVPSNNTDNDFNPNLTRNAGHTPKAAPIDLPVSVEGGGVGGSSSDLATPTPQTTYLHHPSVVETGRTSRNTTTNPHGGMDDHHFDEDPALHSPLTLPESIVSPSSSDNRFLEALDSRLLQEARKAVYSPSTGSSSSTVTAAMIGPLPNLNTTVVGSGGVGSGVVGVEGSENNKQKRNDDGVEVDDIVETPEPEIKLKFKRSMNFGSAFGSTAGLGSSRS